MWQSGPGPWTLLLRLTWFVAVSLRHAVAIVLDDTGPFAESTYVLAFEAGLAPGATVSLELHNKHPVNNTYVMVLTHSQLIAWQENQTPLRSATGGQVPSSYFGTYWRQNFRGQLKAEFKILSNWSDRYTIIIMNPLEQEVDLGGSLTLVNPGDEQLTLEDVQVPGVLIWMSVVYGISCASFGLLLLTVWRQGRSYVHMLIVLVLFFKCLVLFLHWCDLSMIENQPGRVIDSKVASIIWQLFDKVQTILELMMFLLISLGWKYLRSHLNITEVRFALGISVISFYLGCWQVACKTNSSCSGYKLSRYILHSLCYLVVIVAMNFNLQMVQAQIADAPASQEAGKLYQKHRAYSHFRWIFLLFIIAPTAELFVKISMMPWDALWAYYLMQNLRTWFIYAFMIFAFQPAPPPLRVFELTIRTDGDDDDEGDDGGGG